MIEKPIRNLLPGDRVHFNDADPPAYTVKEILDPEDYKDGDHVDALALRVEWSDGGETVRLWSEDNLDFRVTTS